MGAEKMDQKTGYLVVMGLIRGVDDPERSRSTRRMANEFADRTPGRWSPAKTRLLRLLASLIGPREDARDGRRSSHGWRRDTHESQ